MESELEQHPGCLLLRIHGDMRLWGHPEAEKGVLEKLRASFDDRVQSLVLNLSAITTLDTMGIATLVRVLIECTKRKVALKVVMPTGVPGESLRRVRIFESWPTFDDEQSALHAAGA